MYGGITPYLDVFGAPFGRVKWPCICLEGRHNESQMLICTWLFSFYEAHHCSTILQQVSDAYQSKSHWGISHSVQDMCCEVDSTSWFPFNTESCPASRTWPEFPSLESKYGSGLVLRSTGKMQEAPLLLRIVQEITDLCYKLVGH